MQRQPRFSIGFFPAVALPLSLAALVWLGCKNEPDTAFLAAEQFSLFSLGPHAGEAVTPHFHGYTILGKLEVPERESRELLMTALHRGIGTSDGTPSKSFSPQHGLRIIKDGETLDYVIAFGCQKVQIIRNGRNETKATASGPRGIFNQMLSANRITLPF